MSEMSTMDIAKQNAIQNELDNLRALAKAYISRGGKLNLQVALHYMRQRNVIMKKHGLASTMLRPDPDVEKLAL